MSKQKHVHGSKAMVEIYNQKSCKSEFHPCTITDLRAATDREYRVNIELENGVEIYDCAPECVVPLKLK